VSASSPLFRFVQVELPWALGPPDGRYLLRATGDPDGSPTQVVVFATLGAPERRRLTARRRPRETDPQPLPTPVATGRATVIDVGASLSSTDEAHSWLATAGEAELSAGLDVLNRALHSFRLVTADPYLYPVGRRQAIAARIGFGAGEQVADGLWTSARDLPLLQDGSRRRSRVLAPQARLAAVLGGRELPLACEELALRARLDVDHGRHREAALQLLVTLDAAIAELTADPHASTLTDRLTELRGRRESAADAAQTALTGPLDDPRVQGVEFTLGRIEAALRARAAASS
jgi:hypothetical protein